MIIKIPRKCYSHKATFPLPHMKKPVLIAVTSREIVMVLIVVTSREIVVGNHFGRKTNLIYRAISRQKHTKLAHIKNLNNLNIGTDMPMQTV